MNPTPGSGPRSRGFQPPAPVLRALYRALAARYGHQPWWPADSALEILVGAVLTQNTAWSNVERAIARLKAADLLTLPALLGCEPAALAEAVRPSGCFNVKARRLRNLCRFVDAEGGLEALAQRELAAQRAGLLAVDGIGPETADAILLYALARPVFVIDAYTRRLLWRLGLTHGRESYEELRAGFEAALGPDLQLYQQYHALIVIHAKETCRKTPRCDRCRLAGHCPGATPAV